MARALPRNVSEFKDRHGKWRMIFRAKGMKRHYFKARIGTDEFAAELAACRAMAASKKEIGAEREVPGSISALIVKYYKRPEYLMLAPSSKKSYRNALERFRVAYGHLPVAGLKRRHVIAILGSMADRPAAANRVLDMLRLLMRVALDEEWLADDPTVSVKALRYEAKRFHTWSEEEIARYEEAYPRGSAKRLAFDLMLYTGQRRSDMVKMGHGHIDGGLIRVKQLKTKKELWIPMHPNLVASIAATGTGDDALLVNQYGRAFTAAGFGNRMREWCDKAGLPECSAHGLRKAMARRLAEAGCTNAQIKAITGHQTDGEVNRYIEEANQKRLATEAVRLVEVARIANKKRPSVA